MDKGLNCGFKNENNLIITLQLFFNNFFEIQEVVALDNEFIEGGLS